MLFIWGMPGSGKSSVGRLLAGILGNGYIDLDEWIGLKTGIPVDKWFAQYGEAAFRVVESVHLKELVDVGGDLVIGCGGGTPCFSKNAQLMNESGLTCFLDVPIEVLALRLSEIEERKKRPLLMLNPAVPVLETISQIAAGRRIFYDSAKVRLVISSDASAHQIAATIGGFLE